MATTPTAQQPTPAEWANWLGESDASTLARDALNDRGGGPQPPPLPIPPGPPTTAPGPRPVQTVPTPRLGGPPVAPFNPALIEEPPDEPAVSESFLHELAKSDPELAALLEARDEAKAAAKKGRRVYTEYATGVLDRQEQDIRGLRDRMPPAPTTERPGALTLPPPPSRALRPFGTGRPGEPVADAANRTLASLGLMAQMGVGIAGGFAPGALAAYSGALEGWAQGDKQRAERDWLDYTALVDKMRLEHDSLMEDWRAAWETWGHDMTRLKTEATIIAAEHGLGAERIKLASRDPARLDAELQKADKDLTELVQYRRDLNKTMAVEGIKAGERQRDREALAAHRGAQERHWERQDAKAAVKGDKMLGESAAKWENAAGERPDPRLTITEAVEGGFRPVGKLSTADAFRGTLVLADQIKTLALKLKDKGLLASGDDVASVKAAQLRGWAYPGDPDLVAFKAHAGTLVGFLRQLGDIGPRAMAAYMSAVNIIENATTAEAVIAAVDQLVTAIGAARPPQPGTPPPSAPTAPPAQAPVAPPAMRGQSAYPSWWVK